MVIGIVFCGLPIHVMGKFNLKANIIMLSVFSAADPQTIWPGPQIDPRLSAQLNNGFSLERVWVMDLPA